MIRKETRTECDAQSIMKEISRALGGTRKVSRLDLQRAAAIRRKLTQAFKALRRDGYFAEQNWWCCQTCGLAAVPADQRDRLVFYHTQDAYFLRESGEVCLCWSGDGHHIKQRLEQAGLFVQWNGEEGDRLCVSNKVSNA
jgi:hypothetical protein